MNIPDADGAAWEDARQIRLREVTLCVAEPGVLSGRGAFETLAVRQGRALDLELHLDRLERSAERLGLGLPERGGIRSSVEAAASAGPTAPDWVKIVAFAGRAVVFGGGIDPDEVDAEVSLVLLPWRRALDDPLSGCKTLNYAGNSLGLEAARRRGAQEGLWLNTRGHLAEGCTSNVFVIRGRRLFTPSQRDGILPGTVRHWALVAARKLGLAVHEGKTRLIRLERADEAFLTSSVRGVRPVVEFQGKPVGKGRRGPWTVKIAAEVARLRS